jgi:hypothetical protein
LTTAESVIGIGSTTVDQQQRCSSDCSTRIRPERSGSCMGK